MMDLVLRFVLFSGIFFVIYKLVFSRLSFFQFNRGLLLIIPAISLAIPWLASFFENPLGGNITAFTLPTVFVENNFQGTNAQSTSLLPWSTLLWMIYGLGALASLAYTFIGMAKSTSILRQAQKDTYGVYYSVKASTPFTFFRKIVIPYSLKGHENLNTIIRHEKIHVAQLHSLDNFVYQIWKAVFWFNPFLYGLSKELRQTHEAIADQNALEETSKENYAQLLLDSALGRAPTYWKPMTVTANPFFNSSLIKNRITMIYNEKSPAKMKWLYLLFVPLLAGMTAISCNKAETSEAAPEQEQKTDNTIVSFKDADQPPLFPGCDENASKEEKMKCFQMGIMKHVQENFKYPGKAEALNIEGKIFTQFVIGEDGKMRDVEVMRGLPTDTDDPAKNAAAQEANQEAVGLVNTIPNLTPAIKNGKKVAVRFTLPIMMKLE